MFAIIRNKMRSITTSGRLFRTVIAAALIVATVLVNSPAVSARSYTAESEISPVTMTGARFSLGSLLDLFGRSRKQTPPQEQPSPLQQGPARPVAVDGGNSHSVILYSDGTVVTLGDDTYAQRSTSGWRNITQISTFADHTLGLRSDGSVVAAGLNTEGQCDVDSWRNIVSVAAGSRHSVGVRADGTVVAVGANESGQCNVSGWANVKSVAASNSTTFGLTRDGKILTAGSFTHRSLNSWSQISMISVSTNHVVAVHVNGTVSAAGANDLGQCDDIAKWNDIQQIVAGYGFTAGLRASGKVWVHGCDAHNEHAAMQWTDIVAIGSGREHLLGIRSDGTLVAKGTNDCGQCDVYSLNQKLTGG